MKNIISSTILPTEILASNLPEFPIIGAFNRAHPENKSFVVMKTYHRKDSYCIMCREGFDVGNAYSIGGSGPCTGTLENVLSHPSLNFVLFDSPKELFKWLAE
jgi:hypothetical protein